MPTCSPAPSPATRPAWPRRLRRAAAALAACAAVMAAPARAALVTPDQFSPTVGQGNLVAFDPAGLAAGWAGSLGGLVDPATGLPIDLVSVALFTIDPAALTLSGRFELTEAGSLGSTLFGVLGGTVTAADLLANGGQLALDYLIQGGTGVFGGATGFGLAFIDVDPMAAPDNYRESGLFVVGVPSAVPEPGSAALVLLALVALLAQRVADVGRQRPAAVAA